MDAVSSHSPCLASLGPACFSKHTISVALSTPPPFYTLPAVDGISSLSWSPLANYLIVASWDNHVRCYNVQPGAMTTPAQSSYMAGVTHQQPVLCSAWLPDGQKVVSAGELKLTSAILTSRIGFMHRVSTLHGVWLTIGSKHDLSRCWAGRVGSYRHICLLAYCSSTNSPADREDTPWHC